ncbi:hypothetical protein REPUB_Repub03eG0125400 [Reevesia pubescens]
MRIPINYHRSQPPKAMVGYDSTSHSVEADYNQDPFCGSINVSSGTDVQIAAMAQHHIDIMRQQQQPALAMLGYDSTSPSV